MDRVVLGNTRLEVSRLCFGGIPFGGRGWRKDPPMPPNQAAKILERDFELGQTSGIQLRTTEATLT